MPGQLGTEVLLRRTLRSKVLIAVATELGMGPNDLRTIAEVLETKLETLPDGVISNLEISDVGILSYNSAGEKEKQTLDLSFLNVPGGLTTDIKFEFGYYLPNRYRYSALAANTFGPLYILYAQASGPPVVTIDDEYFDPTVWSLTRPTHSETLNTYYAIGYDEGTTGAIGDMLGVRQATLLEEHETVSVYVAPDNSVAIPGPTTDMPEGTKTPPSPWKIHDPATDTSSERAYYSIRTARELTVEPSDVELPEHNSFRVTYGNTSTEWFHKPFLLSEIDAEIHLLISGIVGSETVDLEGSANSRGIGTEYTYSQSRQPSDEITEPVDITINGGQNIFIYDLSTAEQADIRSDKSFTFVLRVLHTITSVGGNAPVVIIRITAGSQEQTYRIEDTSEVILRFKITEEEVHAIGVSAVGVWRGVGRTSGFVRINSAELYERGSLEDVLDAWFAEQYAALNSANLPVIPSELAQYVEGAPGTVYRQASQQDRRHLNIVATTNDDNTLTVEGDHIAVRFSAVGATGQVNPAKTEKLGNGRYRYTSPVNRPLFFIADIPENWNLGSRVTAQISGQPKSIAETLTQLETLYHQLGQQLQVPPAIAAFHRVLSIQHRDDTVVTAWMADSGYALDLMAAWLGVPDIHNLIPGSSIGLRSPVSADENFHLQNYVLITGPDDSNKDHVIHAHLRFPSRVTNTTPIPVVSVGKRGVPDEFIDVFSLSILGFTWQTKRSDGRTYTSEHDEILPGADAANLSGVVVFDDTTELIRGWDLPAGENTFTLRARLKENGNPFGIEQTFTIDARQATTTNYVNQTLTFTQGGTTFTVRFGYTYNATTRRFVIVSGGRNYLPHRPLGTHSVDELEVTITRHRSQTITEPAVYAPVQVHATSGTRIGSGTETEFDIYVQTQELSNGNLQVSMSTRDSQGNVAVYTRQDLGIDADVYDFSRIRVGHPLFDLSQIDYINNPLANFTDAQLRGFATTPERVFGLVTEGSTNTRSFDEFQIEGNVEITGEFTANGQTVYGGVDRYNVVKPVGTTGAAQNQYDIERQRVYVSLVSGTSQDEIAFFLENIPETGTRTYFKRRDGQNSFIVNVARVSGHTDRLSITLGTGSVSGATIESVREE